MQQPIQDGRFQMRHQGIGDRLGEMTASSHGQALRVTRLMGTGDQIRVGKGVAFIEQ